MSQFLKQSTACNIMFGPFVDKTDGVTLETGAGIITSIDHATTGIFLSKAGAAAAIRSQAVTASVLDAYGMFKVTLSTTDTNTVGTLDVLMAEAATFLPVHKTFMVLPANVYDSLMGTDLLDVNAAQWLGTAILAPGTAGTPDVNAKLIGGTAQTGNDVGADVNDILVDTGTTLDGKINTIDGIVDDILVDTAVIGALGAGLTAITDKTSLIPADPATETNVNANETKIDALQTDVTTIKNAVDTEVGAIKAVTDKVDSALVLDGAVYQFTANALELAPVTPTAATIADAVWDELQIDHVIAASFGELQWLGNDWEITGNQLKGKGASGAVLKTFNLTQDGAPTEFNPDKKEAV